MFKLNIIRKALNLGYDLSLTKNPKDSYVYSPFNPFVTENSTYYKHELELDKIKIIGKIKSENVLYNVLGSHAYRGSYTGLGGFAFYDDVGYAYDNIGFLGCASKEIALHFGKYFGMLIIEAKYADMVDFEIIEDIYGNTK